MQISPNPIVRLWKRWLTLRSNDLTITYREQALRVSPTAIILLRKNAGLTGLLFILPLLLLQQVFSNLVGNAAKYTGKKGAAIIEIGRAQQDGQAVIHIRDNSAGFDMQYADKLFGVFNRLHSDFAVVGSAWLLSSASSIFTANVCGLKLNRVREQRPVSRWNTGEI